MSIDVTPHLNFRGTAREALELYRSVFDGELMIATYADQAAAGAEIDPADADLVLFGQVTSPAGFRVMAYDVPAARAWSRGEDPFFVSVRGSDQAELTSYWERLSDGATVLAPLAASGWSPLYGMLRDRFGVTWVLDIAVAYAG